MNNNAVARMGPTRTERIFAATMGPVVGLDTPVLHQNRRFTVELLIPTVWRLRQNLTHADAQKALLESHPCRAANLSRVDRCPLCGQVLDISPRFVLSNDVAEEPLPPGIESYTASIRPGCTSSRRHLHTSTLVLETELQPGLVVYSAPFTVYARRSKKEAPSSAVTTTTSPTGLSPLLGSDTIIASAGILGSGGIRFVVFIKAINNLEDSRVLEFLNEAARSTQALVPGLLMHKGSHRRNLLICIAAFATDQDAEHGVKVSTSFTANKLQSHPNPLNRNLVEDGTVTYLSIANNW